MLKLQENPHKVNIPLCNLNNKHIYSYDIDVLARNIFYTTEKGLFMYSWSLGKSSDENTIKISDKFKDKTKIRFDNVGKMLYIMDIYGIHISVHSYREFTDIIQKNKISNFEIISEIGYFKY